MSSNCLFTMRLVCAALIFSALIHLFFLGVHGANSIVLPTSKEIKVMPRTGAIDAARDLGGVMVISERMLEQ